MGAEPQWGPEAKPLVRGTSPLKLTFSYFGDYFLNKIIIEIGKIRPKSFPFAGGGLVRDSEGQRDEVPLKLTTFSYFRDYFLNKIITKICDRLHSERGSTSAPE